MLGFFQVGSFPCHKKHPCQRKGVLIGSQCRTTREKLDGEIGEDIPVRGSWFALAQGYFADCRYTAWFLSGHPEAEQDCS